MINIRFAESRPNEVYIGRAGYDANGQWDLGYFGNPVRLNRTCPECGQNHKTRGATLPCYKIYLKRRLLTDSAFRERVKSLYGKTLLCFCKPGPCHGDILVRAADLLNQH